jgi:hypothetical protein
LAVTEDEPPAAYTRALEERVQLLERQLAETVATQEPWAADQNYGFHGGPKSNALGEVVEVLSHGNFEAPAYVGASSGLNLALNLGKAIQETTYLCFSTGHG